MAEWLYGDGYRVHVPGGDGPHPAILFLHGSGQAGSDNEDQLNVGLPTLADDLYSEFLIVAPQNPSTSNLWSAYRETISDILAEVEQRHPLSNLRVITGLSLGGHGTLTLASSLSWRFTKVVPVCGWADPGGTVTKMEYDPTAWHSAAPFADPIRVKEAIGTLPIWLFHGEQDEIVVPERSREVAAILPQARLTLYPNVGHDAWNHAYPDPELVAWMKAPG
ncbi:MAG: hypothetical protein C4320_04915 [Armatimonadota bacterium]